MHGFYLHLNIHELFLIHIHHKYHLFLLRSNLHPQHFHNHNHINDYYLHYQYDPLLIHYIHSHKYDLNFHQYVIHSQFYHNLSHKYDQNFHQYVLKLFRVVLHRQYKFQVHYMLPGYILYEYNKFPTLYQLILLNYLFQLL